MTIGVVWRKLAKRFEPISSTPGLDGRLLVGHALGLSDVQLVCDERKLISDHQCGEIEKLGLRRLEGEPVARILGRKEFYSLDFLLNEATLVPRPETEMLVTRGLEILGGKAQSNFLELDFLELGVGSGCITISILANLSSAKAVGIDICKSALGVAKNNGQIHGVEQRVEWLCGSWFAPINKGQRFDLIVSNPPYIVSGEIDQLEPDVVMFDPNLALNGGKDGLSAYREIVGSAGNWLTNDGVLLLEIGFDQAEAVMSLCMKAGFGRVVVRQDLSGNDRMVEASN